MCQSKRYFWSGVHVLPVVFWVWVCEVVFIALQRNNVDTHEKEQCPYSCYRRAASKMGLRAAWVGWWECRTGWKLWISAFCITASMNFAPEWMNDATKADRCIRCGTHDVAITYCTINFIGYWYETNYLSCSSSINRINHSHNHTHTHLYTDTHTHTHLHTHTHTHARTHAHTCVEEGLLIIIVALLAFFYVSSTVWYTDTAPLCDVLKGFKRGDNWGCNMPCRQTDV
jgi:ABC-type nickel/cobalt efflux system permease component RcnA